MGDGTVRVRDLAASDLPTVVALNNAVVPAVNELTLAEAGRLAGLADVAIVATLDDRLAGFCWILGPGQPYASLNYTWFSQRYDDFAYLDRVAVDPTARRRGVARALYTAVIEQSRATRPVLLCEVNLRPRNDASLAFHDALGFREVGRQDTDGGTKTVRLLELDLSGGTPNTYHH